MIKVFKKIICMVLVLALGMCSVSAFAEPSQEGTKLDDSVIEAMEVLRLFSIIPDYYDYTVDETENVARADFVSGVAKMIGLTTYDGATHYYDVPENHWAFTEINALTQSGIINGVGDKLFRPDDKITKNESYKIIMSVLGYGEWAQYNGGFPRGYIDAAKRAMVSTGVSSGEYITVSDMITIFYNAITASVLEPTEFKGNDISYSAADRNTLLSLYRDIYYREGTITGAEQMSFENVSLEDGQVQIDNVIYGSDIELGEYLGEKVKFFYHFDAKSEKKTVLWAKPIDSEACIHIDVDNNASFNKETYNLTYAKDERVKNITLERGLILVYNGSIVNDDISKILNMPKYTAKLVKDKNGKISTVIVKAYENYIVGSIDATELIIYDKVDLKKSISLNPGDYERVRLAVLGKTVMTFEEIKENNVLSVYLSKDKKYINVHVSVDIVSGVVDSVKKVSGGKLVLVNAIEYFTPDTAKGVEVKAGQSVKLYLDTAGNVAYSETDISSYTPAYLIDAAMHEDSFDSQLRFRVLTKQGEVKVMDCASTVKIDGKSYKSAEAVCNYIMPEGEFKPQLVMMRVNSAEKITMIDTTADNPDATSDDILQINLPLQGSVIYRSKSLGHKAVLNENSIIFSLPERVEGAEDKEFKVVRTLMDWETYTNVETYKVQDRVGYEQFVVVHGYNDASYSNTPVLISHFTEVLDDDGEIIEGIIGYQGVAEREFSVKRGLSLKDKGVGEGDMIRIKTDPSGKIDSFDFLYDYDTDAENVTIAGFAAQLGFSIGYVTDLVDGVIKLGKVPGETDISIYTSGVPCLIYDKGVLENNIYTGSISSAKTYYNDAENCSIVFLTQEYSVPKLFVIYK